MEIKDQLQRTIRLQDIPKRIVSLVPSQTELLCDLGLESQLVGITKFCVHPKSLKRNKQIVGGTKMISLEKIKALNPDLILCNKEENTQAIVAACETVCPVHVSNIESIDACLELIVQYGALFNKKNQAQNICNQIRVQHEDFKAYIKDKTPLKVAYFIWRKPWMVAANQTFINHLLAMNKFENCFGYLERYPEVNPDQIKAAAPDVMLLSSEPYPFKIDHVQELEAHLTSTKIIGVDGEYFSWYGSRLIKAFAYFKTIRRGL